MKQVDWLVAQSFEQLQAVLSAINTLSIHTKLMVAGLDDAARNREAEQARADLLHFLDRLDAVTQSAQHHRNGVTLGVDPRLGQLARKFLSLKTRWPQASSLSNTSLSQFRELLSARTLDNDKLLVGFLRDLRSLLEEHIHSDIAGILGDV